MNFKPVIAIGTAAILGLAVNSASLAYDDQHDSRAFEDAMGDFEREMEQLAEEMAELAEEMAELVVDIDFDEIAREAEASAMAALEEGGIRIESHSDGRETVWIEADHHDGDDASLRVENTPSGEDLIYFYFDGFDQPYSYVIEDGDDGHDGETIIHAYDVASVEVVHSGLRNNENMETSVDSRGRPQMTVHTDYPDEVRILRLDRSRFDG